MSNQKPTHVGPPPLGLRERKKQQTRAAISDVATRMFIERGFEDVTLAEVAAAADVSVNTVFNYFSTKEELFFDRGETFVELPSEIVRNRRRGESAVAALRRAFRRALKGTTAELFGQRLRPFLGAIEASPALKAREKLLLEQSERGLAATLVQESGAAADDPTARTLSAMFTGVESMMIREFRNLVLKGTPDSELRGHLYRLGERSFELLAAAAGDYCVRE